MQTTAIKNHVQPAQDTDFIPDDFVPSVYNKTYYSTVMQDEAALIKWQAGELDSILKKHLDTLHMKSFPLLFDAGSGPSVHHLLAFSKYTRSLHLADFMPENLAEIQKWASKDKTAHNWNIFTKYILENEGREPSRRAITAREDQTRRKIIAYSPLDLKKSNAQFKNSALLVTSFFVADSATRSKKIFKKMSRNTFNMVQPGGLFVAAYLGGCKKYRVGRKWLNSAEITEADIHEAFNEIGAKKITVRRFDTPQMQHEGFNHIFTVVAER